MVRKRFHLSLDETKTLLNKWAPAYEHYDVMVRYPEPELDKGDKELWLYKRLLKFRKTFRV